jgi:hypothetical protein
MHAEGALPGWALTETTTRNVDGVGAGRRMVMKVMSLCAR